MAVPVNNANLRKAFLEVMAATGIGAAVKPTDADADKLLDQNVFHVVPDSMHDEYPDRLLAAAMRICQKPNYGWTVEHGVPMIGDETTIRELLEGWFNDIISA